MTQMTPGSMQVFPHLSLNYDQLKASDGWWIGGDMGGDDVRGDVGGGDVGVLQWFCQWHRQALSCH